MNRYILIRRLKAPAVLLLIGTLALLRQMGVIDHFWHLFWPLLFILIGVIMLAERAVLTLDSGLAPGSMGAGYPGAPYGGTYPGTPMGQTPPVESTSIVPANSNDFGNGPHGGQS